MLRKFLPALCLLGTSTAFAQAPTLTYYTSAPALNDTFISIQCNTAGIGPGSGGTAVTWNFATLTASTSLIPNKDTGSVMVASAAPGYGTLSAAAPILGAGIFDSSTNATVTPSGVATFYISSPTKLSQTGVYINSGNSSLYSIPLDQLHYPFTYNSTFNGTYAGFLSFTPPGLGTVTATQTGRDTVTADGYGTLIIPGYPSPTPATTYLNVLRVHSALTYRDSANLFGTDTVANYLLDSYTWYMPGYHAPLLTISTATGPGVDSSSVSYAAKQLSNHEAVPTVTGLDASVNIYPNPASEYIYISYNNAADQKVRTSILDVTGREVAVIADGATQGITKVTYNISSLAKGTYILRLQSSDETVTRKIEVQ